MDKREHQLFEAVYQHTDLLVIGVDMEGRITHFNPACERLSGFSKEEALGKHLWDFTAAEDFDTSTLAFLEDFREGKAIDTFEYPMRTRSGGKRLISWNVGIINDKDGQPQLALGLGLDISEKRRMEEMLMKSEEQFRLLIENALDLVIVLKPDGTIDYVGPSVRRLLGYGPEELVGRSIYELIHPDQVSIGKEALRYASERQGVTASIEIWVKHKDGYWRLHEASSYNLLDNPAIGGIVINSRDITERKRAEEELERSELEKISILDNISELVAYEDAELRVIWANKAACALVDSTPEQLVGRHCYEIWSGRNEPCLGCPVERALKTGTSHDSEMATSDGRFLFIRAYPVKDKRGDIVGVVEVTRDITERTQAEELIQLQRDLAMRLSETIELADICKISLQTIIDTSGMDCGAVYLVDKATGDIDMVHHQGISESYADAVKHYDREDPHALIVHSGTPVFTTYEGLDLPEIEAELEEGLKGGAVIPIKLEKEIIGCVVVASHVETEIPQRIGDLIRALTGQISHAITRGFLQSALRDSEERFRLLHDHAGEVIFTYDKDLRITSVNRMACEKTGYSREELVGKNLFELGILHLDDLESAKKGARSLLHGGTGGRREVRLIRKDGSLVYMDISGTVLTDEEGEVVAVINIANDITERKLAEEALRNSEERYHTTFESTSTAMLLVERDATISDVNREMEKMFGYSRSEVVNKMRYMDFVAPEDLEMVKAVSLQLMKGETSGPVQYEIKMAHKSGRLLDALVNISTLPGIGRSVVSLLDITDKKSYEHELVDKAQQLRNFLDIAAHELRHPATLMKGYAITMDMYREKMDEQTWTNSLNAIGVGADRLVKVVEELLDLSRIERDSFPVSREEVEVEPLVERAVEEILASGCKNRITVEIEDSIDRALIDSEKFVRLLIILLDNAVKYSPSGSKIEVIGKRKRMDLKFAVIDQGIGVTAKDRERIFDRFYRIGDVLHHTGPGLGLGLYIGKRIVESHGGRIWYEPREGGGSILHFTLPLE